MAIRAPQRRHLWVFERLRSWGIALVVGAKARRATTVTARETVLLPAAGLLDGNLGCMPSLVAVEPGTQQRPHPGNL